jgi:hypothetical protein
MPANLPPQYFLAERKYKEAKTAQEKIVAIEEMLMVMPKHKGTDKLRASLRRKVAQFKNALEAKKKEKRGVSYYIKKQGAGQVVLVGLPNVGKSALVDKLTKASPEVADYPFTTRVLTVGMMPYEDIKIQLIDTPPLSEQYMEPWLGDILKRADLLLIMLDLTTDPLDQWKRILKLLEGFKITLSKNSFGFLKKGVVLANKLDIAGAAETYEIFHSFWNISLSLIAISVKEGTNLRFLSKKIYEQLEVIRVYSKVPGKKPDLGEPFIIKHGSSVLDFAQKLHQDIASNLKFARIWNDEIGGLRVEKDYILKDKDIVELRT